MKKPAVLILVSMCLSASSAFAQVLNSTASNEIYNQTTTKKTSELNFQQGSLKVVASAYELSLNRQTVCDINTYFAQNNALYYIDYGVRGAACEREELTGSYNHYIRKPTNVKTIETSESLYIDRLSSHQLECLDKQIKAAIIAVKKPRNAAFLKEQNVATLHMRLLDNKNGARKDSSLTYGAHLGTQTLELTAILNSNGECKHATPADLDKQFAQYIGTYKANLAKQAADNAKELAKTIDSLNAKPSLAKVDADKGSQKKVSDELPPEYQDAPAAPSVKKNAK